MLHVQNPEDYKDALLALALIGIVISAGFAWAWNRRRARRALLAEQAAQQVNDPHPAYDNAAQLDMDDEGPQQVNDPPQPYDNHPPRYEPDYQI